MLTILLLPRLGTSFGHLHVFEARHGRLKVFHRQTRGIGLARIDVDRHGPRRRAGSRAVGEHRDARLPRRARRRIGDEVFRRMRVRAREVAHDFVEKRHERRVDRKVVPAVVEVGG